MDPGKLLGQGISFPPRVGLDGRVQWSTGEANVREAVRVILLTAQNERLMLPEFGGDLGSFLFDPNNATTRHVIQDRIETALTRWEPRISIESITVDPDPADPQAAIATLTYKLVATSARERVSLQLTLGG